MCLEVKPFPALATMCATTSTVVVVVPGTFTLPTVTPSTLNAMLGGPATFGFGRTTARMR